ncbi:MAG TPA: DUF5681 domain-containing protein [Planctomycetota bacterium]|nr:DUF5681 domain-containing protein [Planctomycetota bacterium]
MKTSQPQRNKRKATPAQLAALDAGRAELFKPGKSGNPGGSVKGYVKFKNRFQKRAMRLIRSQTGEELEEGDALAARIARLAIVDGNIEACKFYVQTADGKSDDDAELTGINFEKVRNVTIQILATNPARFAESHDFLRTLHGFKTEARSIPAPPASGGNGTVSASLPSPAAGNPGGDPPPPDRGVDSRQASPGGA